MARFTYTAPWLIVGAFALAGCPGDDGGADPDTSTGDSTGTTGGSSTVDPDSGMPDSSTGAECDPPCPDGQVCLGGVCFDDPDPVCDPPCGEGEICEEGMCVEDVCGIDGSYDPCFGVNCPDGSICIVDNTAAPTISWCAVQNCTDECDCPTIDGFEAGCMDLTGAGSGQCYIDCSGGSCPEGMLCFMGTACVWSAEEPEPLYGDCVNGGVCGDGGTCVSDMANNLGWCSVLPCADDTECEPAPDTGDAVPSCAPINMDTDACILDCSMGETCPDGMSCVNGVCAWLAPGAGYGNCGLPDGACAGIEACLDDSDVGMDPTWAVCSQPDCNIASDCGYDVPEGGDAVVACGDPTGMGGDNTCYLDCSMGETCPDGMACIADSWCAWPQGTVVFSDNFESGDFMTGGWTLNDVDGLTVFDDPAVDYITDAWVVADVVDMGDNQAAHSTSWYDPAGTSDDWLISPPIMLGPNSRVFWVSRSGTANEMFQDGFEVRISIAGTDIADFEANPELFSIAAEAFDYTAHFVDLAAAGYADQMVHIAWRNVTEDGLLLAVDNVAVVDLPMMMMP